MKQDGAGEELSKDGFNMSKLSLTPQEHWRGKCTRVGRTGGKEAGYFFLIPCIGWSLALRSPSGVGGVTF